MNSFPIDLDQFNFITSYLSIRLKKPIPIWQNHPTDLYLHFSPNHFDFPSEINDKVTSLLPIIKEDLHWIKEHKKQLIDQLISENFIPFLEERIRRLPHGRNENTYLHPNLDENISFHLPVTRETIEKFLQLTNLGLRYDEKNESFSLTCIATPDYFITKMSALQKKTLTLKIEMDRNTKKITYWKLFN